MSQKRKATAQAPETAETPKVNNLDSYNAFARHLADLQQKNGGSVPFEAAYRSFLRAGGMGFLNMPDVQNARVRTMTTRPANYSKDQIAEFVQHPDDSDRELRAVSASLAWSTKTYDLLLSTFPDMMQFHWYITSAWQEEKVDKALRMREWKLGYKIAEEMQIGAKAHEICGLCMKYGKVFYTPRISVDKSHNKVNYAFLQQLPMDFCKIVGWNNGPGKYTVEFNLMYFAMPGTDWRQYGNLFRPYINAWESVVETRSKTVYNSGKPRIDTEKFAANGIQFTAGHPEWELVGTEWMYWVTLPAEEVVVFEIDDRTAIAAPPTTGLMVSMTQIPNYEAAQLEIVLNPLTSVLTGSLETSDTKGLAPDADPVRVSPTVRKMFEMLWYQMLEQNNTSGIGLFLAPANDMKLQTLSDTVSNTNITSTALSDQIVKAGMPAVIPTTNDPKVGVAQLSAAILANYSRTVYWGIERAMNWIFENLNFRTPLRMHMFGNVFDREKDLENARKGMTLGILNDTLRYDAMCGISPFEDIAVSEMVKESGVLDHRIPLVTTYTAKQEKSGLPPQASGTAKQELDPGGRPPEDGSINGEVTEKLDAILEKLTQIE